jgi:SRSO17 transposase
VQWPWCGRLGQVDNCQVGVCLGYASRTGPALVDCRLFLPREWAQGQDRRAKAGVPKASRFHTRHELALALLDEHGQALPHAWITGDDEMGRSSWFRQELRRRGEAYLLAAPSNMGARDVLAPAPPQTGRGRQPAVPCTRADRWAAAQPAASWQPVEVRAGEQGPLVVQGLRTLVQPRTEGRVSQVAEWLVVFREQQADGSWKHDYLLANAPLTAPLAECARVFKAERRIEESLRRAKSEAGLGQYQVRTWGGWHHHQALGLVATWFLTQEARRGEKIHARVDGAASAVVCGAVVVPGVGV